MRTETSGFIEGGFRISWSPSRPELASAHALRADVFCRELAWVGSRSVELERDAFDEHCSTMVVTEPDRHEVLATVRLVPGDRPWMFDGPFQALVADPRALQRTRAMEASRLAVAKAARTVRLPGGRRLAELVFKATYLFCRQRGDRYVYMVTSDVVGRRFTTAGLPCSAVCDGTRMPDGVLAVPLVLDWDALRADSPLRAWFEGPVQPLLSPARIDDAPLQCARAPIAPRTDERWTDGVRAEP
jgi:N-acyl-L-homoserine lactone synthetase